MVRFCMSLIVCALVVPGARAALTIQITKGTEAATPIAVMPFAFSGAGAPPTDDIAGIVASDLARSGRFAPVPRADLPSRPGDLDQVDFTDWRLLRTSHLVIGKVRAIPGGQVRRRVLAR